MIGTGVVTVLGTVRTQERDVATGQRDEAANEARRVGAPALALCTSGSSAVPLLQAAGLCEAADRALGNPVVASVTPPLTPQEIDTIVARVVPATAPGTSLVPGVLDRLAVDPDGQRLDEAMTRAVVAAAVGRADERDRPVSPPGAPATTADRLTGLRFERTATGGCQGIATLTAADGTVREERSTAPDGACSTPAGPTTPPVAEPTTTPPAEPAPTEPVRPVEPTPTPTEEAPPTTTETVPTPTP